ncbi:MAG: proton-conducting transporter membrane subunit [Desulfobacteraceae bacterium]
MTGTVYPALLIIGPLLAAILCSGFSWVEKRACYPVAAAGLLLAAYSAFRVLMEVLASGTIQYRMAGWPPPIGIELRIDLMNALVLMVVACIALVNLFASHRFVSRDLADREGTFYAVYLMFVTGILGVSATGDLFNLYVLLEITSLASYALIAMGDPDRSPLASLNYVFIGVIGASFYLLGVGYIYIMTGSLNMVDVASLLPAIHDSSAILIAFIFCMIGVWIKMALFPLHVWLPNAYTYAPLPVSRVIAPLMTKVMVYVMIRLMLTVFGLDYIFEKLDIAQAVVWLATAAILAGGVMALAQKDIKKMATYIIVSEIGYMVGGAWLGNKTGMTGSILHILNDAVMTFALFLAAGNIAFRLKNVHFSSLEGIFTKMPWTMTGFVLAGFSIIGVPPTCGFFSKWYLVIGGIEAGAYHFVAALIISSLICAVLFFRIFEIGFFSDDSHGHGHGHSAGPEMAEAPISMLIPLGITSLFLIGLGLYSGVIVNRIIHPFLG